MYTLRDSSFLSKDVERQGYEGANPAAAKSTAKDANQRINPLARALRTQLRHH